MNLKSIPFTNFEVKQYLQSLNLASLMQIEQKNQASDQYALTCYQIALYTNLSEVANKIQFLGYDNNFCSIFAIYSFAIDKKDYQKLFLTLVRIFYQTQLANQEEEKQIDDSKEVIRKKIKSNGVTLIFFNQASSLKKKIFLLNQNQLINPISFSQFKAQTLKKMPIQFLSRLNKIIICYPGLLNKSLSYIPSFGVYNSFLQKFISCVDSIYELSLMLGPLFNCSWINKRVLAFDKGKNWRTIFTQNDKIKSLQQLSYYQIQISNSQNNRNRRKDTFYLQNLQDYSLNSKKIPKLLKSLLKQIENKHSKYQGIFRKACDESQLTKMQSQILMNEKNGTKIRQILFKYEPETIASCIKKFFVCLKNPIIPYKIYEQISLLSQNEFTSKEQVVINENKEKNKSKNMKFSCITEENQQKLLTKTNIIQEGKQMIIQTKDSSQTKSTFIKNRQFFQNLSKVNKVSQTGFQLAKTTSKQLNLKDINQINKLLLIKKSTLNTKNQEKMQSKLQQTINKMKGTNQFEVLKYILKFLSKVIISNQKHNLMSAYNISVVFVPCFFRPQNQTYKQLMLSSKFVEALKTMLLEYDSFFQIQTK